MRKELDQWQIYIPGSSPREALSRFFIAVDELRARLNPDRYPNLEISDEGHLWFNMISASGGWEIIALPEGNGDLPGPALMISKPHKPGESDLRVLQALGNAPILKADVCLIAASIPKREELNAYLQNSVPEIHLLRGKEEILAGDGNVEFYNYFGLYIPAMHLTTLEAEHLIRDAINRLEGYCTNHNQ